VNFLKCTTEKYNILYARWIDAEPGRLLDLAKFDPTKDRLLDLCGGTGAVSDEAMRRGKIERQPILIDLNPRNNSYVHSVRGDAQNVDTYVGLPQCSVVVIRQAMAYLDPQKTALALTTSGILTRRAHIAFNLFAAPRWGKKSYDHKGRHYFEASGFIGNKVGHIQACRGSGFDISVFRYTDPKEVVKKMEFAFDLVKFVEDGKSVRVLMQSR